MASLLDIGPLTEDVEVHGITITVQGLTAGHLFQLFAEFPDMRRVLEGSKAEGLSPGAAMLKLAPDLIAKIIALATEDDADRRKLVETKAKTMGAGDQLVILAAVQRLSFPDGIGPFVERTTALMTSASAGLPTPSAISDKPTTESPQRFNASLQTDIPAGMRGHARRVN